MKKFDLKFNIYKLERGIIRLGFRNKYPLITFFISVALLEFFSTLPYFNLLINKFFLVFLILSSAIAIFRVTVRRMVILSILLILLALPFVLIKNFDAAELLANYAYGFLMLATVRLLVQSA